MSLQMIIYAKQNGAQMATFAATATRADIDDLRKTMAALGTSLGACRQYYCQPGHAQVSPVLFYKDCHLKVNHTQDRREACAKKRGR